ncbi:MAG: DUF63 family protein [Candidatus Aenigmatarchaeota archaeon]|nr:MAG: DUF63 family protein [Candidatus Aenigmarchaeota archaeon]
MDFIHEYFLIPLMRNGWFNPVNSLVYGIGLIIGIWLVYNLLKRVKVPIDGGLFIATLPFIAFAGVTRALRDYIYFTTSSQQGFLSSFSANMSAMQEGAYDYILRMTGNNFLAYVDSYIVAWFPTPGSYFITFLMALLSLFVALGVRKYTKIACWKTMFVIGSVLFAMNASLLTVTTIVPLLYIGSVALAWTLIFFGLTEKKIQGHIKKMNKKLFHYVKEIFTTINASILSAHFFDATATFFAIAVFSTIGGYGYTEQHFLSRSLIPFLGPQVMFLLKFVVIVPVLYYIDRYTEDRELSNFLKLVILILGLAPAARNLTRLLVGV